MLIQLTISIGSFAQKEYFEVIDPKHLTRESVLKHLENKEIPFLKEKIVNVVRNVLDWQYITDSDWKASYMTGGSVVFEEIVPVRIKPHLTIRAEAIDVSNTDVDSEVDFGYQSYEEMLSVLRSC